MAPPWISTLASIGMAVGPPLVYVDQTASILKKKYVSVLAPVRWNSDSSTFSEILRGFLETSVQFCAQLKTLFCASCLMTNWRIRLLANITRCFFWLGEHYEFALLVQSLLMILCQVSYSHIPLKKADLS
jgi:solute carrier family 66, member 2